MRVTHLLLLGLALCAAAACRNVCMTVLDACRDFTLDAGYEPAAVRDAAVDLPDAGVDAGFPGCIKAACAAVCQGLDDPRQVCLYPACVACQTVDGGAGAVFCGYLYSCGRDAGTLDAAVLGSSTSQSSLGSTSSGSSSWVSSLVGAVTGSASQGRSGSSASSSGMDSSALGEPSSQAPVSSRGSSQDALESSSAPNSNPVSSSGP